MKLFCLILQVLTVFSFPIGSVLIIYTLYLSIHSHHLESGLLIGGVGLLLFASDCIWFVNRRKHIPWVDLIILVP